MGPGPRACELRQLCIGSVSMQASAYRPVAAATSNTCIICRCSSEQGILLGRVAVFIPLLCYLCSFTHVIDSPCSPHISQLPFQSPPSTLETILSHTGYLRTIPLPALKPYVSRFVNTPTHRVPHPFLAPPRPPPIPQSNVQSSCHPKPRSLNRGATPSSLIRL